MNRTKSLLILAAFAAPFVVAQVATAQVPAEVEGPITAAVDNGNGTATLTVMGMTVNVPAGVPIATPTAALTVAQLTDPTPLPGRTQPGFIGGTAIVIGTVDLAGVVTAQDVFVEPAENVVLGVVTSNTPDPLTVNNVPVVFLADARIPAGPPLNDLGFEIDINTVPVGTEAGIEGYFDGTNFQAFLFEGVGIAPLDPGPQVSAVRAQGRLDKGELEVRGALSGIDASIHVLEFRNADTGQLLGRIQVVQDPALPGTAVWRARGVVGVIPNNILVTDLNTGAFATAVVDIR